MSDDQWRRRGDEDEDFGPPLFAEDHEGDDAPLSFGDGDTGPLPHWTQHLRAAGRAGGRGRGEAAQPTGGDSRARGASAAWPVAGRDTHENPLASSTSTSVSHLQ